MCWKTFCKSQCTRRAHTVTVDVDAICINIKFFIQPLIDPQVSSLRVINDRVGGGVIYDERIIIFSITKMPCWLIGMRWCRTAVSIHFVIMSNEDPCFRIYIYFNTGACKRLTGNTSSTMQPDRKRKTFGGIKICRCTEKEQRRHPVLMLIGHDGKIRPAFPMILPSIGPHAICNAYIT